METPSKCTSFLHQRSAHFSDHIALTLTLILLNSLGNRPQLGNWDANQAVVLDGSYYTNSSHTWVVTMALEPGMKLKYTFLDVDGAGEVTWEGNSIRAVLHTYTVPKTCKGGTETVYHVWEMTPVLRRRDPFRMGDAYRVARLPYTYRN